jgi:hypothetical protein
MFHTKSSGMNKDILTASGEGERSEFQKRSMAIAAESASLIGRRKAVAQSLISEAERRVDLKTWILIS